MTLAAMIPNARTAEHNATLNGLGFGPENFSVPVATTHTALCYSGRNLAFIAAVQALLGVQVLDTPQQPEDVMDALAGGHSAWQRI